MASEPTLGAVERLEAQAGAAGVVLDLREDGGPWLDGLLARLKARAAMAGRLSTLILAPLDLLDVVAAQIADPGTAVLVDPEPEELDAALAELVAPLPRTVSDTSGEKGSRQLAQLSERVERIARTLADLSIDEGSAEIEPTALSVASVDGQLVRALLRLRRVRGQFFLPALFADPAWDILLNLAAARIERRRVAVSKPVHRRCGTRDDRVALDRADVRATSADPSSGSARRPSGIHRAERAGGAGDGELSGDGAADCRAGRLRWLADRVGSGHRPAPRGRLAQR